VQLQSWLGAVTAQPSHQAALHSCSLCQDGLHICPPNNVQDITDNLFMYLVLFCFYYHCFLNSWLILNCFLMFWFLFQVYAGRPFYFIPLYQLLNTKLTLQTLTSVPINVFVVVVVVVFYIFLYLFWFGYIKLYSYEGNHPCVIQLYLFRLIHIQ